MTRKQCSNSSKNAFLFLFDKFPITILVSVPLPPRLLNQTYSNVTNTSISLQWVNPKYQPGILSNISIAVIWDYIFKRPQWCSESTGTQIITDIPGITTSYSLNALPYSKYKIEVRTATSAGWGNASNSEIYYTKAGISGPVTELDYNIAERFSDPNILDTTITWGIPCFFNSEKVEYFNVTGRGNREGFEQHRFTQILNYTTDTCGNDTCSLMIEELRDEHFYTIEVTTKVGEYKEMGEPSEVTIEFPAGSECLLF